jgi:ABC-type polysaccharide/polyol phosphate export permease
VNYLVQVGIILTMFATAVVYPVDPSSIRQPWAATLLAWNPMSSYLDAYRSALLLGEWPWARLAPGAAGAVVALAVGGTVFRSLSHRFAEEV